jgi:hypothetical protein
MATSYAQAADSSLKVVHLRGHRYREAESVDGECRDGNRWGSLKRSCACFIHFTFMLRGAAHIRLYVLMTELRIALRGHSTA